MADIALTADVPLTNHSLTCHSLTHSFTHSLTVSATHSHPAFATLPLPIPFITFLILTASSRPSAPPSDSPKCLRFGHWLTLCTLNVYLLTYSVTVDVAVPPSIVNSSRDTSVQLSADVTLECFAAGKPTPTIAWFKYSHSAQRTGHCLPLSQIHSFVILSALPSMATFVFDWFIISHLVVGWLGGSVGRALARDRKVASSTPGQSATE